MLERRKFHRYPTNLKAYFPNQEEGFPVKNVSWKGVFIITTDNFRFEKRLIYFEIEIPEIGRIPIYGYIAHYGTPSEPGLGVEIIEIANNLAPVWGLYIKAMNFLNEAKEEYEKIINRFSQSQE
jgi:hypothetical protein